MANQFNPTQIQTITRLTGLAEHQPIPINCMFCEATGWYDSDSERIRWKDSADGCLCRPDPDEVPATLRSLVDEDGGDER